MSGNVISKVEKNYLSDMINNIKLAHHPYLDGIFMVYPSSRSDDQSILFTKLQNLDTWLNKIDALSQKITYSLRKSMEYCEQIENFYFFNNDKCENEINFEYFLENGVFRVVTLWEC